MKKQSAVKEIESGEKQEFLFDVAEKLFAEHGFDGTSIRMIAEKSGMNVAMISYYFGSKEKMLEQLIASRVAHMRTMADRLVQAEGKDPWQKMEMLIDGYVDRIMNNQVNFHKLMMRELSLRQRPEIVKAIEDRISGNMKAILSVIEDGIEKKIFRTDVDFPFLMMTLFGTVTHAMSTHKLPYKFIAMEGKSPVGDLEAMRARTKNGLKIILARYMLVKPAKYNYQ